MTTTNFKRRGATPCSHGHLHRDPTEARLCDAAFRYCWARRNVGFVLELRAILDRNAARNVQRGL